MLRKLAVWLFLIPISLNGLWMLCNDVPSQSQKPAESSSQTDADAKSSADCTKECSLQVAATEGSVCIISADNKTSITIVVFGVAVIPPSVQLHQLVKSGEFVAEWPALYLDPSLAGSSPPPRA
jgi:hypothetical protein